MTFNFDMARIGQTIARLRREHNMTQMALADEMGRLLPGGEQLGARPVDAGHLQAAGAGGAFRHHH